MRQNINFGKLLHGGDYNPEQWLEYPEILEIRRASCRERV